ncbi:Phosphoribosylformylglycinamidine synthase 2 protein [Halorhabdus tiamatea SARL4B]|uniref:Phosphoribosylformylglycinamidine synthase subunit PurL n=1 Tax=Halorhabdus tiamatea SARL4B TaxID=1033806 RepID=F7PHB0_9EURY|nr:phosphoribosylformylglycinamidine synthase subunit PurL [Halorhabdus tiamatea]ERJ05554.1 Phosphoribosylformylglycinamidine synthase 2 protein [Halorhabdus tiamatea SARL4B]CCQ32528.1 phosphoribosylformylglycinamidine synthase, subunit II [Halorhabdus tiamatea SARL4B]
MALSDSDRAVVVEELDRDPTAAEAALFENLWSEHCSYRSSRPLLGRFESDGEHVVVPPGDDAGVVALPEDEDTYLAMGIESHNHPSFVDPYDGAATGVGGIVRDILSMGAFPIALTDSLYFGDFEREHSRYLLDGVVEGISDYGNSIGVPTVAGSTTFHEDYEENPLVNVACVGMLSADRLITAEAQAAGNNLVLVGASTGRDGLGGASFASEDIAEDAETEDRSAVQVGNPYREKLLIETNEALIEEDLVESARDLGAAGLGGASSELVAKGGFGADIDLDDVPQREPNMTATEILLSESQERIVYEVTDEHVARVQELAERYDLEAAVIGEVTEDPNYTCTRDGEVAVDVPAEFVGEGAPLADLAVVEPEQPETDRPGVDLADAVETVLASPNTASKRWVYRQYDHEVQVRTAMRPGDDAALLALREARADRRSAERSSGDSRETATGLAISAGADPNWTDAAPYEGAFAAGLENATNIAAKGATPLAAVDCLNAGNPEKPEVYGEFAGIVDGLSDVCSDLSVPVVGGNVSLYNDSSTGPIPPTPTLTMVGTKPGFSAPPMSLSGEGTLVLVGDLALGGDAEVRLGGSELLAEGGSDRFPELPDDPATFIETLADVADHEDTLAVHDVSHGGLAVTLAEMIHDNAGADVTIDAADPVGALCHEQPGRAVIETTDPAAVEAAFDGVAPVVEIGEADDSGTLDLSVSEESVSYDAAAIADLRSVLEDELD